MYTSPLAPRRSTEEANADATYAIRDADLFRFLDEIDSFNHKISVAVGYLEARGHHREMIVWALGQHLEHVKFGGRIPALVFRMALAVDEQLDGAHNRAARAQLLKTLVAAGALRKSADLETLRKKLSDARKERKRPPRSGLSVLSADFDDDPDEDAHLLRRFPDMKGELKESRKRKARLRKSLARRFGAKFEAEQRQRRAAKDRLRQLRRLGLLDDRGTLHERMTDV